MTSPFSGTTVTLFWTPVDSWVLKPGWINHQSSLAPRSLMHVAHINQSITYILNLESLQLVQGGEMDQIKTFLMVPNGYHVGTTRRG